MLTRPTTELITSLKPCFIPPHVPAGNDWLHCDRMVRMGPRICLFLTFNAEEYVLACWLHNVDRSSTLKERIKQEYGPSDGEYLRHCLRKYLYSLLYKGNLPGEAKDRIVDAVMQYAKKDDEPGDSPLLTALRIADKVDRLDSVMGVIGACAMRGYQMLAYDPDQPFGYDSTIEGKLHTIYNDFVRQLEWYGMLPSDYARALVPLDSLRFYCEFVRRFAVTICVHTGAKNDVESDLRKALGAYYALVTAAA